MARSIIALMPTRQLTDDELAELREIFSHFDHNENGVIEVAEFSALLEALDADFSAEEVAAGLEALDTNDNGTIEFNEFVDWWADH